MRVPHFQGTTYYLPDETPDLVFRRELEKFCKGRKIAFWRVSYRSRGRDQDAYIVSHTDRRNKEYRDFGAKFDVTAIQEPGRYWRFRELAQVREFLERTVFFRDWRFAGLKEFYRSEKAGAFDEWDPAEWRRNTIFDSDRTSGRTP